MSIFLQPGDFISSASLPTSVGLHLIQAPTGCGKSYSMTRHAADDNGIVIFPVKAVMTQQTILAKQSNIQVNIIQLERFVEKYEGIIASGGKLDFNCIHFDECQLFYEGGFRPVVEHFTRLLVAASKIMPVYCYSATYNNKFSPVTFDTTTIFEKPIGRKMDVIQIDKANANDLRRFTSVMADIIEQYKETIGYPVLCFINSVNVSGEVKENLIKRGISATVSSSNANDRNKHVKYIMENSKIAGCGVDVIISTSSLEAGININDNVTIITEQCVPGLAFQRFGRARNNGHFVMMTGTGNKGVEPNDSNSLIISFPGSNSTVLPVHKATLYERLNTSKCVFDNNDHRAACDKYQLFSNLVARTDASVTAVASIQDLGYEVVAVNEMDPTKDDVHKRGTKKLAVESKGDPQYLIDRGVQEDVAVHAIKKWEAFKLQYKLYGIRSSVAPEEIYLLLNKAGIAFLELVARDADLEGRVTEYVKDMRDRIADRKMTDEHVNTTAKRFWSAVVDDPYFSSALSEKRQKQLFCLLVGLVFGKTHWSIEGGRAWWNTPLDSGQSQKLRIREKTISESGKTIEQVCEQHNITKIDLVNMNTKVVKQLCSDGINW